MTNAAQSARGGHDLLVVEGLRKSHGGFAVLHGIDLRVASGSIVALIGPSGSGKSTLLRCINHLDTPDAGEIRVDGEPLGRVEKHGRLVAAPRAMLRRQRARVGMVFQSYNLFPHMTALENVMEAPVSVLRHKPETARAQALAWLDRVGLADRADRYPRELSGGQQQRVAIARALAMSPKLMLFDEATAALDPELVEGMVGLIREIAAEGMAVLLVTHEMRFAARVAHECIFMDGGVILERGPTAELLRNPKHPRMRQFLKSTLDPHETATPRDQIQ